MARSCGERRVLVPVATALVAAGLGAAYLASGRHLRLGATGEEAMAALPGDDLVPEATIQATRAITVSAPAADVWPWIAQLGQEKGGLYTYAALENLIGCRITNADRIVQEWQHPGRGGLPHPS